MTIKWRDRPRLPPRIQAIVEDVSLETGVPVPVLMAPSRARKIARARWIAWRRMRALDNPPSFPLIGYWFGKDHTTIIHGVYRDRG
jgi:chromosomal replication initiation ATPase DnaA